MATEPQQSQQAQQLIGQAQAYQQQLQNVVAQKEAFNMQLMEIKRAVEELENVKEDVYKVAGPILVKSDPKAVKKELEEKVELIDLRLKTLEKGEEKLKKQIEDLKLKLSKIS
ncbi:MAG: prefoldin subunit beta [Candidatus Aenigmarchaeota archaeon]|nr:prefoldin subunit beta [Candidatus Aenigmarchaeota archaeon]